MVAVARLVGAALGVSLLAQHAPDAAAVRDKLDAYLLTYQDKLSAVVAQESLFQQLDGIEVVDHAFRRLEPGTKRTLESEVSFGNMPGESGWLGFRRVRKVDGRSLKDTGPSIDELLRNHEQAEAAKVLLHEGARHNLGGYRNANLPNLPLEMLRPQYRLRFVYSLRGTIRIDGTPTSILVAEEMVKPSLIHDISGFDLPSLVTAWVDDTGRLLQAEVRALRVKTKFQFEPTVRVIFGFNRQLDLLVPVEMREEFWSDIEHRRGLGVAKYKDFRRFETSARIIQ